MTFLLKAIIISLGYLPESIHDFLAQNLGRLASRGHSKRLIQLRINVDQILGLPAHTSFAKTFYQQVFSSQLRCFLDTCKELVKPGTIRFDGLDEWQELVQSFEKSGRPVIFAAAHIGSWELTGKVIAMSCNRQVKALAKWPKVQGGGLLLEWLRQKFGLEVLWSHKKSLVRDMMGTLKTGAHLAMVIDQKPEARAGEMVDFYGFPVAFVGGPAAMSQRCNAPIISVATVRTGIKKYRVIGKLVYDPKNTDPSTTTQVVSQLCASEVERWIRLYPEQWTWEYKRWVFAPR
jgi:KDO2-lipid IV(A) lauroyltransferase